MSEAADRNLLFGVMALQMGFVDCDGLIGAMTAWLDDREKPLGTILLEQDKFGQPERDLVELAVRNHLQRHGDPGSTMTALGVGSLIRSVLDGLGNADFRASLSSLMTVLDRADRSAVTALIGRATSEGGRYRILRSHASGGLGEVFVARDEELGREVALKEIQAQYAHDSDLRARFVLEAEVTGNLEHPGIVPIYGLGRYEDGRPYYAMRLIQGESLMEAIRRFHAAESAPGDQGKRTLELRQLLGRFLAVCHAVAYAHSRGVLHRDLKPHNVMLGPYGETLLVDWGLAKIIGRDEQEPAAEEPGDVTLRPASAGSSAPTQFGFAVGTPAYMSPEQAAGLVDQLGPASDIYSLGAMLYVLLTGRTPCRGNNVDEVRRRVIAGKFPPPRKVDCRVPPPLEAVCLKAMALDPDVRYCLARELADEIEAYLADEPVRAWREPLRFRVGRWMRRRRTLVSGAMAAVLVALLSLSIGVILLTGANNREREAKELATERAREARQNFQIARGAVDKYLTRVSRDPRLKAHGLEPLRRELLETSGEFYEQFIEQKPEDAELRWERAWAQLRLADVTKEIGSSRQAIELLEEALEGFQALASKSPDDEKYQSGVAQSRANLGILYGETGRTNDAREALLAALALTEELVRRNPDVAALKADLAGTYRSLAKLHVDAKEFDEAESAYKSALSICRELLRAYPEAAEYQSELAGNQSNLGLLYHLRSRHEEAAAAMKAARRIQQRLTETHADVPSYQSELAATCNNLALLYGELEGRFAEAEAAQKMALQVRRRLAREHAYVTQYQRDLARSHNNLATLYSKYDRLPEAEEQYQAAREIHQQLADEHPEVSDHRNDLASTLNNLANLYGDTGRPEEALAAYQTAIEIREQLAVEHTPNADYQSDLATTFNNFGSLLALNDRLDEAENAYRAALKIRGRLVREYPQVGRYAVELGTTYAQLGHLVRDLDRPKDSLDYCRRAITILTARAALVRDHPGARLVLRNAHWGCAEALSRLGKHAEAIGPWDRALELDPGSDRKLLRLGRAESLAQAGNHVRAVAEVEDLVKLAEDYGPVLYRLAAVAALASAAAAKDDTLAPAERERIARQYAATAVAILRQTRASGYLDDPAHIEKLKTDPRLAPLRGREDFRELLGLGSASIGRRDHERNQSA